MAEAFGIQVTSFSRWLHRRELPRAPARLGRPEVIPASVRLKLRNCYVEHYGQWGPTVLASWARREGLGSYSQTTIDKVIADLKDVPAEKPKPICYEIASSMVMWSEDGADFKERGKKKEGLVLQDEHSRFKVNHRLAPGPATGEQVVDYLREAFDKYGAPLVLKHDGGSIFKADEVKKLLDEYGVVSLTSPPRYPGYNGKKERSIRDIKSFERAMRKRRPLTTLEQRLDAAIHDLNEERPRPVLTGRTAREVFEEGRGQLPPRWLLQRQVDQAEQAWLERASSRAERRCSRRRAIEEVLSRYQLLVTMADVSTDSLAVSVTN
jgi:transposase InsO family protein